MKIPFCTMAPRPVAAFLTAAFAVVLSGAASARPVSADEAALAAFDFLAWGGKDFVSDISATRVDRVDELAVAGDKTVGYVVKMDDGTIVVTSGDTKTLPIVAVSDGPGRDLSEGNPLLDLFRSDLETRMRALASADDVKAGNSESFEKEWEYLLGLSDEKEKEGRTSSISDIRVAALTSSTWGQDAVGSLNTWNYYTPNHWVCGCVATSMSQLMFFHAFPSSVSSFTRWCQEGTTMVQHSAYGGTYSWSSMPATPSSSSLTLAQRQAMGKLSYDCGVSVCMQWTSGSSGAYGSLVAAALKTYFGYDNAVLYHSTTPGSTVPESAIKNAAFASIDARFPVIFGIRGHSVVGDGYGFSGSTAYTHINYGWNGKGNNYWYNLPTISVPENDYSSTYVQSIVYNVFPSRTGNILSGRVFDTSGNPVSGATVTAKLGSNQYSATTSSSGVFAFVLPTAGSYTVSASHSGKKSPASTVSVSSSVSGTYSHSEYNDTFSYLTTGTIGNSWGNNLTLTEPTPDEGSLQDAVDNYSMTFTSGGDAPWRYQTFDSYDGSDAARSGSIGSNGTTWMRATGASGRGIVSFRWKVSSEAGYDWVEFYVDGDFKFGWSGTGKGWRYEAFNVGTGSHTFEWVYTKDGSYYSGSDCAWVDQVKFASNSPLTPIYRFYSSNYKGHFFTMNEGEMVDLVENNPNWNYEGVAYFAYPNSLNGTVPLYRFYSKNYRGHFYTRDYDEYWTVRYTNPNWKYEGEAYYIRSSSGSGSTPIYRFWSKAYRHHFYTADYDEYWTVRYTNPNWNYEGIAFYAWETPESLTGYDYFAEKEDGENSPLEAGTDPVSSSEDFVSFVSSGTSGGRGISGAGVFPVGAFTLEVREEAPDADELAAAKPVELPAPFAMPTLKIVVPDGVSETALWSSSSGEIQSGAPENGAFGFVPENAGEWTWFRAFGEDGETAVSLWLRLLP